MPSFSQLYSSICLDLVIRACEYLFRVPCPLTFTSLLRCCYVVSSWCVSYGLDGVCNFRTCLWYLYYRSKVANSGQTYVVKRSCPIAQPCLLTCVRFRARDISQAKPLGVGGGALWGEVGSCIRPSVPSNLIKAKSRRLRSKDVCCILASFARLRSRSLRHSPLGII